MNAEFGEVSGGHLVGGSSGTCRHQERREEHTGLQERGLFWTLLHFLFFSTPTFIRSDTKNFLVFW